MRHSAGSAVRGTWNLTFSRKGGAMFFWQSGATGRRIAPNHGSPCHIFPNLAKPRQLPNVAKFRQMLPNLARYCKMRSGLGDCEILPLRISCNLVKFCQILSIMPSLSKSWELLSNLAKASQILSILVIRCQLSPHLVEFCHFSNLAESCRAKRHSKRE